MGRETLRWQGSEKRSVSLSLKEGCRSVRLIVLHLHICTRSFCFFLFTPAVIVQTAVAPRDGIAISRAPLPSDHPEYCGTGTARLQLEVLESELSLMGTALILNTFTLLASGNINPPCCSSLV